MRSALLLQFLPLLVFAVVDGFVDDPRISIGAAVAFAAGQLAVTWLKTRRLDWFLVLDVALIVALGGVSIAFDNELFFKLKPALIEGLSVAFIVGLVFAPARLLIGYFGRFMPGVVLTPEALRPVKRLLLASSALVLLHIGAVVFTALRASKETWAFVSGPGFYLLLLPMFGLAWLQRRRNDKAT